MSSISLSRALALSGSALALSVTMSGQTAAQQQGDVQIRPASQSAIDSLDNLEQLLLAPPEEQNRLNVYVTPQYRRERYEAYNESGQIFENNVLNQNAPLIIDSPDFETEGVGISIGSDYLFDSKWLLGAQVNYTNTEFDYETSSENEVLNELTAEGRNSNFLIGDPVDREIDEYGISVSAGYLAEPWTALLTVGYARRNIETETRKVGALFQIDRSVAELHGLEADFNSDIYSADLGGSYRLRSGNMSLQPFMSIGYQIEDVEGYAEDLTSLRDRISANNQEFFTSDPRRTDFDVSSNVDDQTIHSVPGRIGVLFSTPLSLESLPDEEKERTWKLRTGLSFTHDFSDQKRQIRSFSNNDQDGNPDTIDNIAYEEENRNRNFFSLTAALGFDFSAVNGSLNYQRDIGLDERKSADILSLQLRVPL